MAMDGMVVARYICLLVGVLVCMTAAANGGAMTRAEFNVKFNSLIRETSRGLNTKRLCASSTHRLMHSLNVLCVLMLQRKLSTSPLPPHYTVAVTVNSHAKAG
jgi:hypothetical protein